MSTFSKAVPIVASDAPINVTDVHSAYADYLWASLFRLGVREADLPDMLQEVLVVVHRRGSSFDHSSSVKTWLFAICLRVASTYRRSARFRREELVDELPTTPDRGSTPEDALLATRARQKLARILDALPLDKRAVFVMFELEQLSCDEIARTLEVPVGTVYSRLHAARDAFQKELARVHAKENRGRR